MSYKKTVSIEQKSSTVARLLWQAAEEPPGNGDIRGICRVCGGDKNQGLFFENWVRPTFNDWDKLVSGTIICHVCQFVFEEHSQILASHMCKKKPQRMRNYSHFVVDEKWIPLSKSHKRKMAEILLNESPEVAVVAQSGQKHIIFRAVPRIVQFEEVQIRDLVQLGKFLGWIEQLYNGGISKTEIATGHYSQRRILNFGLTKWRQLEKHIRARRSSALFELAIFLAQKEKAYASSSG